MQIATLIATIVGTIFTGVCAYYARQTSKSSTVEVAMSKPPRLWPLVVIGFVLVIFSGLATYKLFYPQWSPWGLWGAKSQIQEVRDRTFQNEVVPLDGYAYINCIFNHVTFRFDGNGQTVKFQHNTIDPSFVLEIGDNQAATDLIVILKGLGLLKPNTPIMREGKQLTELEESHAK